MEHENERMKKRRRYQILNQTVEYASSCEMLRDGEGERIALWHAMGLLLDLYCANCDEEGDGGADAVELDGMREMSRPHQDIQEAGEAQEERTSEAHVVPVVQERDAASREVLTMNPGPPLDSKHGTTGINPKRGKAPKLFRLYLVDASGDDVKLVDTGTAAEISNRNVGVTPKWVYNHTNKPGRPGNRYRVESIDQS